MMKGREIEQTTAKEMIIEQRSSTHVVGGARRGRKDARCPQRGGGGGYTTAGPPAPGGPDRATSTPRARLLVHHRPCEPPPLPLSMTRHPATPLIAQDPPSKADSCSWKASKSKHARHKPGGIKQGGR